MDKEDKKLLEGLQETVPGMRKGITKRDIVKSLTKEEWKRIDDQKKAEQLWVTNKTAYKLHILNDQLLVEKEKLVLTIRDGVTSIQELKNAKRRNAVDILAQETKQTDNEGVSFSIEDLKTMQIKIDTKMSQTGLMLRSLCSKLHMFIDQRRIVEGVIMNEKEYQEQIRWVEENLRGTGFKLLVD